MNKHILICACIFIETFYSFGADFSTVIIKKDSSIALSLQASTTKSLFLFKDAKQKEELNNKLKNNISFRESLRFEGLIIENLDLSGMCLRDIDFSGGTFINVKFNNADLTGTRFNKANFDKVDLIGAILDCPLDDSGKPIMEKAFKITMISPYLLVDQYSELMKKSKFNQAQSLNKLFAPLHLNLQYMNLIGYNLIGIDLENANLLGSSLQSAILSDKVTIPNYLEGNKSELFNLWCNGDLEQQQAYQKLVNNGFGLMSGVDHTTLIEGIKLKKDLRNADLQYANLQGADLKEANLQNACLFKANLQGANLKEANLQNANLQNANLRGADFKGAYLQNAYLQYANLKEADLTGANLQNANLYNAKLQRAILSDKVTVPDYPQGNRTELFNLWCNGDLEYQQAYQKLVNNGFSLISGVDHTTLIEGIKLKKDLRNAYFSYANLQGADLKEANLQNAKLQNAKLQGADLKEANLQNAKLQNADLQGANLKGANLQNANLEAADLKGADLTGANLQNANLINAKLKEVNLTGAKIGAVKLYYDFTLPKDCEDNDLIRIYKSCTDEQAKPILKQILEGKNIPLE